MKRSHYLTSTSLAVVVLLLFSAQSSALKLGARRVTQSTVLRASQSEMIVLGTVGTLEPDILKISQVPGGPKVNYMVAVVKVHQLILGTRELTHVRVGFVPSPQNNGYYDEQQFNGRINYGGVGNGSATLREGEEACFFLVKHHEGDFYTLPQYCPPLKKSHTLYDDELKEVKKVVQVLQNPLELLKSKESTDRQFAAAILLQRYNSSPRLSGMGLTAPKKEPIDAEESKLILKGLSEMTWGDMGVDGQGNLSLQSLFWQLALTEKDGWRQPTIKENEDYNSVMDTAVKKWAKENSSKYRLQRPVLERKKILE